MKKIIIGMAIGLFTGIIGVVGATYLYHANEVSYKDTNVDAAIGELYDMANNPKPTSLILQANPEANQYGHAFLVITIGKYKTLKVKYSEQVIHNANWYAHDITIGSKTIVRSIQSNDMTIDLTQYNETDRIVINIWAFSGNVSDRYAYIPIELY